MIVITPQVTKVIRRDPFIIVHFNIPRSDREIVNDLCSEDKDIISFGTVKYTRIRPLLNPFIYVGDIEDRKKFSFITDEEYNAAVQVPPAFLYLKKDIYDEVESMPTVEKIQYAAYLYNMINKIVLNAGCSELDRYMYKGLYDQLLKFFDVKAEDVNTFNFGTKEEKTE